jgi:hypothetical protein
MPFRPNAIASGWLRHLVLRRIDHRMPTAFLTAPMSRYALRLLSVSVLAGAVACASAGATSSASLGAASLRNDASNETRTSPNELPCTECEAIPMPAEITRAVEGRIVDLKARGGDCSRYGAVLESSYRSGQITLRPFMWRVGTHLASGEAKPNGDMMLAREIDSLNVGLRTVNDVLWTMEHEAAHIAFELPSGNEASEDKANQTVRACKA